MTPRIQLLVCLAALLGAPALAKDREKSGPAERTIGDLAKRPISVPAGAPVPGNAEKARTLYRQFLEQDSADPKMRAEAIRRLADLSLESAEGERSTAPDSPAASASNREAIALYTQLLEADPGYPRADAVLYQLARAWEAEGDPDRALQYLDRMVAGYPNSRLIDEAQFRRGEILFSGQRWSVAEAAYSAVAQHGASTPFRRQAIYKQGWSLFKQSRTEESVESFLDLLDIMLVDPNDSGRAVPMDALSRADRELVDDAFRAMALQFAAMDGAATANDLVARHGRTPYEWLVIERLGDLLVEKERYTDAADTYRSFAARNPTDVHAPVLQSRAIEAYRKGGFGSLVITAKQEYVERYRFSAAFWQGRTRESAPEVVAALKGHMIDVARNSHAMAQRSHRSEDFAATADWYREYLQSFPDDADASATNYLLAESLFEARRFGEAAEEYERTAYNYAGYTKAQEAAYASIVAFEKHGATLSGPDRAAWHDREMAAEVRFATTFPRHPEAPAVQMRAAQQRYELRQYREAADIATQLLALWPERPVAEQRAAWNLIADAEFEQGRFAEAEAAYLSTQRLIGANDKMGQAVTDRLAASVYKQGEAKRSAGDLNGAVGDLLRVSRLAPSSDINATARYDAAVLLLQMKDWNRAIDVLEEFRRDYPKHEMTAGVPRQLALAYAESGRGREAAVEYRGIADDSRQSDELRREALAEAGRLFDAAGATAETVEALRAYVRRYPNPIDPAISARVRLADLAGTTGAGGERKKLLQEIIEADRASGGTRTDFSREKAAYAALEIAGHDRDAFAAINLKAPLKKSLQAKRMALEAAVRAYENAAAYSVAEVVNAATFETGNLYRRLATDLLESERPRELDADALDQYQVLLEEQAFPFEEKAIELHTLNAARSRTGLFDGWIQKSYQVLAELKPARYGRSEFGFSADLTGSAADAAERAGKGEWAEAVRLFDEASKTSPVPDAAILEGLGIAERHLGHFAAAERAYSDALAIEPARPTTLLNLGVLLDLYLERPAEAMAVYERYQALRTEPDPKVAQWIKEVRTRAPRLEQDSAPPVPSGVAPQGPSSNATTDAVAPENASVGASDGSGEGTQAAPGMESGT
ncbi:MAG: tetratricopeptide repeat protein [Dehalococcoidia bacterium]